MNISEKDCLTHFQKGKKALKTSFFSFKFSPDYTLAIEEFLQSAKGYLHLNKFQNSIESFLECSKCNKKITDYFSAGQNLLEISQIYFFNLSDIENGILYLKQAVKNFQMSGKFANSIKIIIEIALKFMSNKELKNAEKILLIAYDECISNSEEKLIRISFEDVFNKLLDVQCGLKKYVEAIKMTENYVKNQISNNEDKYKINKNLMKLGILRIIINEDFKLDEIIGKMYQNSYEDTKEDANDLRKVANAIKNSNKKDFNYCVSSAFTLFENNLLKGLMECYKKNEEENSKNPNFGNNVEGNKRVINVNLEQGVIKEEFEDKFRVKEDKEKENKNKINIINNNNNDNNNNNIIINNNVVGNKNKEEEDESEINTNVNKNNNNNNNNVIEKNNENINNNNENNNNENNNENNINNDNNNDNNENNNINNNNNNENMNDLL